MKIEKYMESAVSGISRVQLVAKNIVFWFPVTRFKHTLLYLIVRGVKLQIFEKKPSSSFNYYKRIT